MKEARPGKKVKAQVLEWLEGENGQMVHRLYNKWKKVDKCPCLKCREGRKKSK